MSVSYIFDKAAIGLSLFCAAHCLLLPLALVLIPALTSTTFGNEEFHQWMLAAVLPTSLLALTLGCRQHQRMDIMAIGLTGLAIMILAALFGHDLFGESGEKVTTLVGASLIALSHIRNQSLCRRHDCQHH